MEGVKCLITVTRRELMEDYIEFFGRYGVNSTMRIFCRGTATHTTLNLLGMEKTEKVMFLSVVSSETAENIKKGLKTEMNIEAAGKGIHYTIPLDGIGGGYSKNYLLGDSQIRKEEKTMEEKSKFVLLITIADKGNAESIMNAARSAGATGGTVVPAKGTGADIAKFFGVAISEEKETVYIVAKRENRDGIMKAIMEQADGDPSRGVIFSLPVEDVVGVRALES